MKLATLQHHNRDGKLIVVSRDLTRFIDASSVAPTLQAALDDWQRCEKPLQNLFARLEKETNLGDKLDQSKLHSPLPRAYEWVDGSAYLNHVSLVRRARGAEMPESFRSDPLVYQGGSGDFLNPRGNIPLADEAWGCDFESEVCVILGDTPQGTKKEQAGQYVRLITIANDVSLRNLIPNELAKGFGFFNSKPATAFGPIAVTPDELGDAWKDGRVHLPLLTHLNDKLFGRPHAGPEMHFSFFELLEHITKTRAFTAGTILGSGTVSNEDESMGCSCIAEKRTREQLEQGKPVTPFLKFGDRVEIEMLSAQGQSIFGKISQQVVRFTP